MAIWRALQPGKTLNTYSFVLPRRRKEREEERKGILSKVFFKLIYTLLPSFHTLLIHFCWYSYLL